jgi:hypothetical protein
MQSVLECLEVIAPSMFVPLMEYVIYDVHASRQIFRKGISSSKCSESCQVVAAVGAQISLGVWHDDSQYPVFSEYAPAIAEKYRQLLSRIEVLQEVLDSDAGGGAIGQREIAPAIPTDDFRARGKEVEVHESRK